MAESTSRFVPDARVSPSAVFQLPPVDAAVGRHRVALEEARRSGDPGTLADAYGRYDNAVFEARVVYEVMQNIFAVTQRDVAAVRSVLSAWMHRQLDDADTPLSARCMAVTRCEAHLASLSAAPTHESLCAVAVALADLGSCLAVTSAQMIKVIVDASGDVATAWREQGFASRAALRAHRAGTIPLRLRTRLVGSLGQWRIDADAPLLDEAWSHFNKTTVGLHLGMCARYACPEWPGDKPSTALEQLIIEPQYSLFDATVTQRLAPLLHQQPNASLPPTCGPVPLLALLFAAQQATPPSVVRNLHAPIREWNWQALHDGVRQHCTMFGGDSLVPAEERAAQTVPNVNTALQLAHVFWLLAQQIASFEDTAPSTGWTDWQQSLWHWMRALRQCATGHKSCGSLAASLMFWMRYTQRGSATKHFWQRTLLTRRLLGDLRAFSAPKSLWSATTWTFDAGQATHDEQ